MLVFNWNRCPYDVNFVFFLNPVTGMAASVGMFTSSLGHKGLYHRMILLINAVTVMQMLTRLISHY